MEDALHARRYTLTLFLALALPIFGHAKPLKKLTDPELITVVETSTDSDDRVEAIDLLADRGAKSAIPALGALLTAEQDPNVAEHALGALEDIYDEDARVFVFQALLNRDLKDSLRLKAAKILGKQDQGLITEAAPLVLADYRTLKDPLAVRMVEALPNHHQTAAHDYAILIATDGSAGRKARMAAFEAAETLDHPQLYRAYLSMLSDSDKKIRIKAVQGLGRSGLPAAEVAPALTDAARNDQDGPVRAAAFKSLRLYASPDLLPTLHHAALNEKAPVAWFYAVEMLQGLADTSSIPVIGQLFGKQEFMADDQLVALAHTLVRIGDASAVPSLEALARATESEVVRTEATAAADILRGPEEERTVLIAGWPVIEVTLVDMTVVAPPPPPLAVSVDVSGGVSLGTGVNFSTSIAVPGVQVEVDVQAQ